MPSDTFLGGFVYDGIITVIWRGNHFYLVPGSRQHQIPRLHRQTAISGCLFGLTHMHPRLTSCALLLKFLERFSKRQCGSQIGLAIAERFHVMVNCDCQSDWSKECPGQEWGSALNLSVRFFFQRRLMKGKNPLWMNGAIPQAQTESKRKKKNADSCQHLPLWAFWSLRREPSFFTVPSMTGCPPPHEPNPNNQSSS